MEDKSHSDSSGSDTKVTEESGKSPIHVGAQSSDDSKISIETGPSTAEDKSIQSKITMQESNEPTKGTKDKESEVSDSSKSEIAVEAEIVQLMGATKCESNLGEGGSRDMKPSARFDQTEQEKGKFSGFRGSGIRKNVARKSFTSREFPVRSEFPTSSATDPNFPVRETGQGPDLLISTSGNGPKVIPTASTGPNVRPSVDELTQFLKSAYKDDMDRSLKMGKAATKDKSWKKSLVDRTTYFDPSLPKDSIGYEADNEDSILSPNASSGSNETASSIQNPYAESSEPLPGPSSGDSKIARIVHETFKQLTDYFVHDRKSGETGETAVTQTSVATDDKPSPGHSATGPIKCSINIAHLVNISRPPETSESEVEPISGSPIPQSPKEEDSPISPIPQSPEEEDSPISPIPQSPEEEDSPISPMPQSIEIESESASGTASRVVSQEEKGVSGIGSSRTQSGAAASGPGPSVTQSPEKEVGGAESRKRSKVLKPESVPETGPSSIKKYRGTE